MSPCERYIAAAGYEAGTEEAVALLLVWELPSGKEIFRRRDPEGGFKGVSFRPDGKRLAAGGAGSLRTGLVWAFPSGKSVALLGHDEESIKAMRFSPEGQVLATATLLRKTDTFNVVLWDAEKFHRIGILAGPAVPIVSLAFASDGKLVAAGDAGGTVHIWNVAERRHLRSVELGEGPRSAARALCFADKGGLLAAGMLGDGRLHLLGDGKKPVPLDPPLPGGKHAGYFSVRFGSDARWLFASGRGAGDEGKVAGRVQVWNVAEKKLEADLLGKLDFLVLDLAVTRDGRRLIGACNDGYTRVWRLPEKYLVEKTESK